jgi:hypothetical protein
MKKDAKKTVRFDEELTGAINRAGQDLDREFSNCVRHILKSWLREKGYLSGLPSGADAEKHAKKKKAYTIER